MRKNVIFTVSLMICFTPILFGQEVKFRFSVLDENGRFHADLKPSDIKIAGYKDLPLSLITHNSLEIMILIDASASQERTLPIEKMAAGSFIDEVLKAENDKVAIVSFTGTVALEQDLTNDFRIAKEQISKIEFVPPAGFTIGGVVVGKTPPKQDLLLAGASSIWESITQVLEAFSKIPSGNSQKAIILISDGVNTFGESKLSEAIKSSLKAKIPIYAIGIGDDFYGGPDMKSLKKIAGDTGGISVLPEKKLKNLSPQLKLIESSLRSNYEVVFTKLSTSNTGKMQEVKIEIIDSELKKRKLQIVKPKGYFAFE